MTDKAFTLLGLFSLDQPAWTVEQIAPKLGVAVSSAYRLVGRLGKAGLVDAITPGRYVLGPAIIQLDRQIQLTDPLVHAAGPVMDYLVGFAPEGSTILLCRAFRDAVLCVHQVSRGLRAAPLSYERGRPRPLFRGATSKAILAFMPRRVLKRLYGTRAREIQEAGLGGSWKEFLSKLRVWRVAGHVLANSEVDKGRFGIAAPVLGVDRKAMGSLSFVLDASKADERTVHRLIPMVMSAAREVERSMSESAKAKIDITVKAKKKTTAIAKRKAPVRRKRGERA
ncbi:MAG: helix-turn-helix domain-containing protein [Pseudomonadota bacterium]|nr:helix-turn-helix domain-containing protein [Pseudomonadota bacterium]